MRFHIDEGAADTDREPQDRRQSRTEHRQHFYRRDRFDPDQPYSDFNVASDRNNALALYYNQGFHEMPAIPVIRPTGARNTDPAPRIDLTYTIDEGAQVLIERVLTSGYEHTRDA